MKVETGDMLLDVDYALSVIGVAHRQMELADAYYMVLKHNEAHAEAGRGRSDG